MKPNFVVVLVNLLLLASCKKNDTTDPNSQANVTIKFTQVATNTSSVLVPFTVFANDSTHYFPIADAQSNSNLYVWPKEIKYYISNIRLEDHYGNLTPVAGLTILLVWDSTTSMQRFSLGKLSPAHYHYIHFDIGVDSASNHADPTLQPNSSPLSLNYPGAADMQWGWDFGYKFFTFVGKADTTGGHANWTKSLQYHLGTDAMRQTITLPLNLEAQPTTNDTIAVFVNHSKLFNNINIRTESFTETNDNVPLANKIKANLPSVFSVGF